MNSKKRNEYLAKLMGWTQHNEFKHLWYHPLNHSGAGVPLPAFVDSPTEALVLVQVMSDRGYSFRIENKPPGNWYIATFFKDGKEFRDTQARAFSETICYALLQALGIKVNKV